MMIGNLSCHHTGVTKPFATAHTWTIQPFLHNLTLPKWFAMVACVWWLEETPRDWFYFNKQNQPIGNFWFLIEELVFRCGVVYMQRAPTRVLLFGNFSLSCFNARKLKWLLYIFIVKVFWLTCRPSTFTWLGLPTTSTYFAVFSNHVYSPWRVFNRHALTRLPRTSTVSSIHIYRMHTTTCDFQTRLPFLVDAFWRLTLPSH